jgi:hypothetical protein
MGPGQEEARTPTVFDAVTPIEFNSSLELSAAHFRSRLQLCLVDARGDKKVGRVDMSVFALMQRQTSVTTSADGELTLFDLAGKTKVGRLSAAVQFTEDWDGLYLGPNPRPVRPVPEDKV